MGVSVSHSDTDGRDKKVSGSLVIGSSHWILFTKTDDNLSRWWA